MSRRDPARAFDPSQLEALFEALDATPITENSAFEAFASATRALLDEGDPAETPALLERAARAFRWAAVLPSLQIAEPEARAELVHSLTGARHLSPDVTAMLLARFDRLRDAVVALARREALLARMHALSPGGLRDAIITATAHAVAALDALVPARPTRLSLRIARDLPWLAALAHTADPHAAVEHDADPTIASPLLAHASRVLRRKLGGLEAADIERFQDGVGLGLSSFHDECARVARIARAGLMPCLRAALLLLDFAKGGTRAQRAVWHEDLNVDLTVHNEAAFQILQRDTAPGHEDAGVLDAFPSLASPGHRSLVSILVRTHGLTGQLLRGETPLALFAPLVAYLREGAEELTPACGESEDTAELVLDALHLVNVCDTAGVRESLMTDSLRDGMLAVRDALSQIAAQAPDVREVSRIETSLVQWERKHAVQLRTAHPVVQCDEAASAAAGLDLSPPARRVSDRLARLRRGRIDDGEPLSATWRAVAGADPAAIGRLAHLLETGQLWYMEAASAGLSPSGQLKLIGIGLSAAYHLDAIDTRRPFHLSFQGLVERLNPALGDRATPYRIRLLDALLEPIDLAAILEASPALHTDVGASPLGTFETVIGGSRAIALDFEESEEAHALMTLLPIYETRSSAAFHSTLKTLCDLYGLRKDEFDRISNEALYLVHMNSARSDKARMLDHVVAGCIVEVGPGGGVVLDLLEARFPESDIVGVDISEMVVEALRSRKRREGRRWRIVEADAFEMPGLMGERSVDTVIFCSVLHEIYSYVEYPDETGDVGRFRLESVRDLLVACWRTLRDGGRLVIRDGIAPEPGERVLELIADDAREFLELFAEQFEGREIEFDDVDGTDGRCVRMDAADAMEFLYCYTWGAESFPYEVREQYGILPYIAYRDHILRWLSDEPGEARWVELPEAERSYLQPGYEEGLAGRVAIYEPDGDTLHPTRLPDSNCLLVFEKATA